MSSEIETLARGVCVKGGKLLLCRTKGTQNTYLPGGHVDFGESAGVALEREILEELGIPSRTGKFLGAVEHAFMQKGQNHCEINLVFELFCDDLDPEKRPVSREDHIEFEWLRLGRLEESGLEPAVLIQRLTGWLESPGGGNWASSYEDGR